ncbi:MAG: hypothetical protein B6229_08245 [Spirochaetaceae bacterium 4572_7]|nr:MAG: hypothetical protein B6229_08245 [Spirochaetaceae bacterium 4572_7]
MERDTEEFNSVTTHINGSWTLKSFLKGDSDLMESVYETGNMDFEFDNEMVNITYIAKKAYVADKMFEWKKEYPDLKVDSYKVVQTGNWHVDKKGEAIFFDEIKTDLIITGSGSNFESFYAWEKSKVEMTKGAAESGGLLGKVLAQSVTGTKDLFPEISEAMGYWINLDSNTSILNLRKGKNEGAFDVKLSKQN